MFQTRRGIIELAVNYSSEAALLVSQGRVAVDRFKCPPWPDLIKTVSPSHAVYVHFDIELGGAALDLEEIGDLLHQTGTSFVNTHLSLEAEASVAKADLEVLCAHFSPDDVLVENVPLEQPGGMGDMVATPEFVRDLVQECGCGFLLDLAHARWSAETLGVSVQEFISSHPLSQLRELHVTGLGKDAAGCRRDSMKMQRVDWELLEWSLDNIAEGRWPQPWAVVLEYGGVGPHFSWRSDPEVLTPELNQLARLLAERGLR